MLWVPTPKLTGLKQTNLPATPAASYGQVITSGSANAKGSWSEVIASTDFDVHWLSVVAGDSSQDNILLDIGIGAASSEVVLIADLMVGWLSRTSPVQFRIPTYIPKGTRVAARSQADQASDVVNIIVSLHGQSGTPGGWHGITKWDAIGLGADSGGTTITPGGSGAYSSWTSVGSTTSRAYKAIFASIIGTQSVTLSRPYNFEFGYNSTALLEIFFETFTSEVVTPYPTNVVYAPIPSGTQMQCRATSGGTAQDCEVVIWGGY